MNVNLSRLDAATAIRNRVQSVQNRVASEVPKSSDAHRYDQGGEFRFDDIQLGGGDRISNISTYKSLSGGLASLAFDTPEGSYSMRTQRATSTGLKHGLAVAGSMVGWGGMMAMSIVGLDSLAAPFAKLYAKSQTLDEGPVGNTSYVFRPKQGGPTQEFIFNASGTLTTLA